MGNTMQIALQRKYPEMTEEQRQAYFLQKANDAKQKVFNKGQKGLVPTTAAPPPSTFSYNPLPPNMAAAPGLSTAPGLSLAPGLNRVTTQGVASPFAGMSFGGTGLMGLGQAASAASPVQRLISGGGGAGFSGLSGGPSFYAPVVFNPGMNFAPAPDNSIPYTTTYPTPFGPPSPFI